MNKNEQNSPLWQLQQQVKHYDSLAISYGNDAQSALKKSEEARVMAEKYRKACEILESHDI